MNVNWERVLLWILILIIIFKVFRGTSYYTASSPLSIMDLAEFIGIPDDVKQFYQDQILNKLLPAASTVATTTWTAVPATRKQQITGAISQWINAVVNAINNSSPVIN